MNAPRDVTWEEVVSDSNSFIDSLDRSILGRFAVPRDVLSEAERAQRSGALAVLPGIASVGGAPWWEQMTALRYLGVDGYKAVFAEVAYWWSVSDELLLTDGVMEKGWTFDIVERLRLVVAHPHMHDYFDNGIWDIVLIERCIADGVDAELALSTKMCAFAA